MVSIFLTHRLVYHPLSPADAQLCLFIFPQQQKQQCGKMEKKGFPEPGKSTLPLSWQAVSQRAAVDANGTDSLQNLNDSISLGLHRKGSRSSQPEGVGTISLFYSPSNHKGIFYWFIWMIIGQKAERAPCPSTISCGGGFVAMSCTSTGALNSAIARQNQSRTAEA